MLARLEWNARFVKELARLCKKAWIVGVTADEFALQNLNGAGYEFLSTGFKDDPEGSATACFRLYDRGQWS